MSQIQEVKEASDIVALIGERIQLQRSSSNFRGLCPFHGERSPSFFVSETMQRYKCFGCGETGDVFTFLERYEAMTFGESMKYLAERAGIALTQYHSNQEDDHKEQLLAVLNLAKEYYHYLLTTHPAGEPARAYLKERGITAESIRLFQLGYSLDSWQELLSYLHGKKKFSLELLAEAGLTVSGKQNRPYDRFRGRLMFPLTNHRGQVVGFSGRILDSEAKEAKYINSPETTLYHKSQMLYGYSELFQEIRKKKEIIIVEGEVDVISSSQAHVNNVAAIKGSAFTADHLKLISRVAETLLFSLDMDSAGTAATKRAITLTKDHALDLRVIV
ncbi:MAG: DNA primase, partial [bacterium]|nr:DNA primase [bacterium]